GRGRREQSGLPFPSARTFVPTGGGYFQARRSGPRRTRLARHTALNLEGEADGGGMRSTLGLLAATAFVLGPVLAWLRIVPGLAAVQQACCADLHPARLAVPPADAFARARALAERTPAWTITQADPGAGAIEAVATTRLFGFHDDIAIRIHPDGAQGSRVDV